VQELGIFSQDLGNESKGTSLDRVEPGGPSVNITSKAMRRRTATMLFRRQPRSLEILAIKYASSKDHKVTTALFRMYRQVHRIVSLAGDLWRMRNQYLREGRQKGQRTAVSQELKNEHIGTGRWAASSV